MAAYGGLVGASTSKTSGTTLTINSIASVGVNELVVVLVASDNASGTTPTVSVTDSAGNTYTNFASRFHTNTASAAGALVAVAASYVTTALTTSSTITVTFGTAITAKVAEAVYFTGTIPVDRGSANNTGAGNTTTAVSLSGVYSSGDLLVAACASEDNASASTGDTDTTGGSWSTLVGNATTGGGAASNMALSYQYKLTTSVATQSWSIVLPASADHACVVQAFASGARRTATSSGTGSSTASGNKVTGAQTVSRTASGSGTGSSSATRLVTDLRTASGSGTGTSTATRVVTRLRTASSSGIGGSLAAGAKAVLRSASAAGSGTSTATSTFARTRTASASGTGSSTASRAVIRARTAAASGVGLFDSTGLVTRIRSAAASGVGSGTAVPFTAVVVVAVGAGTGTSSVVSLKMVFRTGDSAGFSAQSAWSERIFEIPVPLRPRQMRKKFFPPPSKPVGRGKPLQPPRVRW